MLFRSEFLNRVDDIVVFRPLAQEELRRIVDIQLSRVGRLASDVGVELDVSHEAKAFLAEAGFDPVFGARPLKRAIQRSLQDPLAMLLLDEEVAEGTTVHVRVDEDASALTFDVVPPAQLKAVERSVAADA